jgi:3-deoxy-D-manno-octulosonic-acid transferase
MSLPPGLFVYHWATRLAGPLAHPALHYRVKQGKEDPLRLDERQGRPSRNRPNGHLVWLHGASVGESRVILTLVRALLKEHPNLHCLVTTGTTTSAQLMSEKLPSRAIHQYVPIDRPRYVRRFLDYWQPDLGIFAESELWPNLLLAADRRENEFEIGAQLARQPRQRPPPAALLRVDRRGRPAHGRGAFGNSRR